MDLETIFSDATYDFLNINHDVVNTHTELCDLLSDYFQQGYFTNIRLNTEEMYALVMYCLHAFIYEGVDLELLKDRVNLLDNIEEFKWMPLELYQVLEKSNNIFDIALEIYEEGNFDNYDNMLILLDDIENLYKGVLCHEFIYRNKDEILAIYAQSISEAIIDVSMAVLIKNSLFFKSVLSMRMREYLFTDDELDEKIINFTERKNLLKSNK